jgi:hypothetical protein
MEVDQQCRHSCKGRSGKTSAYGRADGPFRRVSRRFRASEQGRLNHPRSEMRNHAHQSLVAHRLAHSRACRAPFLTDGNILSRLSSLNRCSDTRCSVDGHANSALTRPPALTRGFSRPNAAVGEKSSPLGRCGVAGEGFTHYVIGPRAAPGGHTAIDSPGLLIAIHY